jgi:hypothetical protein
MDSLVLPEEREPLERVHFLVLEHCFEIWTGHDHHESLTWIWSATSACRLVSKTSSHQV